MSLINQLSDSEKWNQYLTHKRTDSYLSRHDEKLLVDFIENREYLRITEKLNLAGAEEFPFDYPDKIFINKMATGKKRVVYKFPYAEAQILKLLCFLLNKYDYKFSENCYSFRKGRTVKDVCYRLKDCDGLENKYSVKVDIHDYFNSIPVEKLISCLEDFIDDDKELLCFLKKLLRQNKAYTLSYEKKDYSKKGKHAKTEEKNSVEKILIEENRGAMAGCALGGFFANLYLRDVDLFFEDFAKQIDMETGKKNSLLYFRYSDDIIIFADSIELREKALKMLEEKITGHGLSLNPKKYLATNPGEKWDFLGISYINGDFDLSDSSVQKIKAKIKRKAKKLWSWRNRKDRTFEKAAGILIKKFNKLWFGIIDNNENDELLDDDLFNWKRWYFPIITTTKSLEIIDHYFQEYIRFLYSGRHYKGNYSISYDDMKKLGYKSLVHEYYHWKEKK